MTSQVRGRFFSALAELGIRRPYLVLGLAAVVLVVTGWLAAGVPVSTSRTGLVAEDQPEQQRLHRFLERFGRPDAPLVLVDGGTPEERRAVVDALESEFESNAALSGRVLGRVDPRDVADILLLQQPAAFADLRRSLPADVELPGLIEGGVEEWMRVLAAQIQAGVGGGDEPEDGAAPAPPQSIEQANTGLEGLATLATVLDDHLAGKRAIDRFTDAGSLGQRGIDGAGYLVTGNGDAHLVALYPDLPSDEGRDLAPIVGAIRAHRDLAMKDAPPGIRADVTGLPAFIVDELDVLTEGLRTSTIASTLGIALLCLALFRSMRQTLVALVPLLPGVLLTMAAVRILYGDLNLITSSFVPVLLGLGIDFSVHVVSRYNEELRGGSSRDDAVRLALVRTGPGILTGALITAAGFLATVTTEFTAYGELGVITAIGLVAVMATTFVLTPPLLRAFVRAKEPPPPPPGMAGLARFAAAARWPIVIVGVVTAVIGALAISSIAFNGRYFEFLPVKTEAARALVQLEYDPIASPVFANVTASSIEDAREKAEQLRTMESVGGVQTASDLLPPLDDDRLAALRAGFAGIARDPDFAKLAASETTPDRLAPRVREVVDALDEARYALQSAGMPTAAAEQAKAAFVALERRLSELDAAGTERLRRLGADAAEILGPAWTTARAVAERGEYVPSDLPPIFEQRFAANDGDAAALFVVPAGRFWEADVADRFAADVRAVDPDASGLALTHVEHGRMILRGFQRAAAIATVIVLVILLIDFRSVRDSLLALLPTALGWGWMLGAMELASLEFNVANIVALPLVIGIGLAYGVHVVHRCRESDGGSGPPLRLVDVLTGTGGAVAVAALTTVVGFAALTISEYGGMRSLGIVMTAGVFTCFAATVLVLPAVLLMARRAR